jgi:error-prone DNA polymerase
MTTRIRIDAGSRIPLEDPDTNDVVDHVATPVPLPKKPFVELFARSNFSFLHGATAPEKLVFAARALEYEALGLCDLDGFYGAVRALEQGDRDGVKLVHGCELTLDPENGIGEEKPFATVFVHVESHDGYENACRLLTESHARHPRGIRKATESNDDVLPKGENEAVARNTFAGIPLSRVLVHTEGLWATLRPSPALVRAVARGGPAGARALEHAIRDAVRLREAFGERASIVAVRHLDGEDRARLTVVRAIAAASGVSIVASNAPLFATVEEKPLYDILHCIREGKTLDEAGRELLPNAEAHLKSAEVMIRLFADLPDAIARARQIADACRFSLRELRYRFPCELEEPAFEGETPDQALRRLALEGARRRFERKIPASVMTQLEREFAIIAELEVAPYFLSVRTIVEMARVRDILCQGRGSAANSAVCYALGITAVDPSRSNLLFERFLSLERREPPDIDVDFEHERREEVIQAIYKKYGRDRAAMVSEVITYRGKSALREVGKAFGLSLEQVDRLSTLVSWWDAVGSIGADRLLKAGFDPNDARIELVLRWARALVGTPRHLSIHVGGFVLSAEPLERVAPIEPATMIDRTIIPWDKDDLDTLGFFKVDVLGLGMLTAIRKALEFAAVTDPRVRAESAIESLAKVPAEDPCVYDALCKADTVGVFQIESRAQMAMLPRLRPRVFYDLVVEVAIVRPGPIQGGMVHPYLRRRNAEEPAVPPHPLLAPILDRTLGVPLFQEQVMQIAIVGAGYTGGEADQLRRDMAAWRKTGRLERHRDRLIRGFEKRGISREFGERLYAQIEGFGEYGFPESHAASFALLVYASSWLKVFHPAAFAAALVNSQPMGFYSPSTILEDAQRHGVALRPISVVESDWDCTLEPDEPNEAGNRARPAIRVGLRQVKGLGDEPGRRIEAFRAAHPSGFTIPELADGAMLSRKELEALAESGALDPLTMNSSSPTARRSALWAVREPREHGLFGGKTFPGRTPKLKPLTRAEQLSLDYERTGLSIGDHPMKLLRGELPPRIKSSAELQKARHGARISVAGLVICRQRPGTASGVVFITMEDELGFLNLILYARIFEEQRHVATTSHLLVAHGTVEREGEVVYVVVKSLEPLRVKRPIPSMSRDFH